MGMASRSRRYVVVLAPNRDCYWYWVSRVRNAAAGNWPFGKESPAIDFRGVFESAGLNFSGQSYLARNWTEAFLRNLPGIDDDLRAILRHTHASPLISAAQSCYIVAGTGTVEGATPRPTPEARTITMLEELTGALSDSLALRINVESALAAEKARADLAEKRIEEESAADPLRLRLEAERDRADLAERNLSTYRIEVVNERDRADRAERSLIDQRTEVASAAEALRVRAEDAETRLRQARIDVLESEAARMAAVTSLATAHTQLEQTEKELEQVQVQAHAVFASAGHFSEAFRDSLNEYRHQRAWKVMVGIRRAYTLLFREGWKGRFRLLFGSRPPLSQYEPGFPAPLGYLPAPKIALKPALSPAKPSVPARKQGPLPPRKYDVVILAIIDFDFRFQRPQQIAAQFARQGHRVFWVTATRVLPLQSDDAYRMKELRPNVWEVSVRAPQTDLYCGVLSDEAAGQFRDSLAVFHRDLAIVESAVVVQLPFWRRLGLELRKEHGSLLVYDCMDDWDTFENLGNFNREEEVPLAAECDVLVVTAEKLRVKFEDRSLQPLRVRNGA